MNEEATPSWPFGRICAGVFAGSILGFSTELVFFWDGPPAEGIKLPILGPMIGAALGGLFGVAVGGKEIRGSFRTFAICVLVGVVLGVLAGMLVYAPLMTANDPFADNLFRGRVQKRYKQWGILFGIPLGALAGFFVAAIVAAIRFLRMRR